MEALRQFARDYLVTDKTREKLYYHRAGKSYASHKMDHRLIEFFGSKKQGFYIEIGANNGITQSNTAKLEREYGWHGVLIEPSLNNFVKCRKNRSAKNHFACCACVPFDFTEKYLPLHYLDLMTMGANSVHELQEYAEIAYGNSGLRPVPFFAPVQTMTSILDEANAPEEIDLLSLDVEGAELEVLKGIDFARYRFKALLIECWKQEDIAQFLEEKGYVFKEQYSHIDRLFVPSGH